jgi:hypothetical protein
MIERVLATLAPWGPVFFGFGLLAPLIAQVIQRVGVSLPAGFSPLAVGLIVGPALGLCAKLRGRWI